MAVSETAGTVPVPLCYNEACTKDFLNIVQDINCAEAAGFDLIELRFDCIGHYLDHHGSLKDLAGLFSKSRLKPDALNALYIYPEFDPRDQDSAAAAAVRRRLQLLETLHEILGISRCIVVAPLLQTRADTAAYTRDAVFAACTRILRWLLEQYPYMTWIFEPVGLGRSLVRDVDFALQIIRETGDERAGLVLDSYNLFLKNLASDYDFSALKAPEVRAVHLMNGIRPPADAPAEISDQRWRRFCGDGEILDAGLFLNELKKLGYRGMISTEVFSDEYTRNLSQGSIIRRARTSLDRQLATAGYVQAVPRGEPCAFRPQNFTA